MQGLFLSQKNVIPFDRLSSCGAQLCKGFCQHCELRYKGDSGGWDKAIKKKRRRASHSEKKICNLHSQAGIIAKEENFIVACAPNIVLQPRISKGFHPLNLLCTCRRQAVGLTELEGCCCVSAAVWRWALPSPRSSAPWKRWRSRLEEWCCLLQGRIDAHRKKRIFASHWK